jgi:hypothetical protein
MAVTHGGNIFEISRERGWDWRDVLDFSASINPLGPAPGVADAVREALGRIAHYPEREPAALRQALARLWEIDESQLLLGNGATELLHFFARVTQHQRVTLAVPPSPNSGAPGPRPVLCRQVPPSPGRGQDRWFSPAQQSDRPGHAQELEQWLSSPRNPVMITNRFSVHRVFLGSTPPRS